VCKKLIKNSQPFGKKFQKTVGGIFLTHTVYLCNVYYISVIIKFTLINIINVNFMLAEI